MCAHVRRRPAERHVRALLVSEAMVCRGASAHDLVDLLERQLDAAADEVHFGRRGVAALLPHSPLRGEAALLAVHGPNRD